MMSPSWNLLPSEGTASQADSLASPGFGDLEYTSKENKVEGNHGSTRLLIPAASSSP